MTRLLAAATRRAARAAARSVTLARVLAPAMLPALWHAGAQAQLLSLDPAGAVSSSPSPGLPAAAPAGAVGPGLLGTPSSGRAWRFRPRLALTETLTDNVNLTETDRRAEAVTQLTVGAQFSSTAGRLRGFADYALTGIHYARGTASSRTQNALSAQLTAELLERRGFVDVSASITQQALSAFGTQTTDPALANANRTEVRTYRVSPYLRGAISDVASYEARLARSATHVTGSSAGDVATTTASVVATGLGSRRLLNWSFDASRQVVDYDFGSRRESDRVNGSLLITPLPELRFTLIGGREANNYVSEDKISRAVYGARVNWTPGPRTVFIAERQQRFFGASHLLSLSHRMARSLLLASDVQDVVVDTSQDTAGARLTLFDAYFQSPAFVTAYPVAAERAEFIRQLLAANNQNPSALLSSATSVRRSQQVSYTWFGLRDTFTAQASRSDTRRIDTRLTPGAGDLATFSNVRQQGLSLNLTHRLTPLSNLSLSLSQQRNTGDTATVDAVQETRLRSAFLSWSTRLNLRTSAALSARHSRFDSTVSPYRESAVIANLNLQF